MNDSIETGQLWRDPDGIQWCVVDRNIVGEWVLQNADGKTRTLKAQTILAFYDSAVIDGTAVEVTT